jgi:hypothetical protein
MAGADGHGHDALKATSDDIVLTVRPDGMPLEVRHVAVARTRPAARRYRGVGRPTAYASAMAAYFVVEMARGPAWDDAKHRREQTGWEAHATFMDGLVDDGWLLVVPMISRSHRP